MYKEDSNCQLSGEKKLKNRREKYKFKFFWLTLI